MTRRPKRNPLEPNPAMQIHNEEIEQLLGDPAGIPWKQKIADIFGDKA